MFLYFFQRLLSSKYLSFWLILWMATWCSFSSVWEELHFSLGGAVIYMEKCCMYVPSLLPTESAKKVSLKKQCAFLLNVSLRFLQNNIHSDHWLTMQVFNFQMLETFLFWYKKVKKSLAHLLACMRKHPLQETLSGSPQTLGVFLKVQLQQTRSLWVGLAHPCAWSEQTAGELLCVAKHRTHDVDPHLFSAECCWHCQSSSVLPSR